MRKSNKAKLAALLIGVLFIVLAIIYFRFREAHTFTLSNGSEAVTDMKSEEIQPIFGTVTVWGTQDTDVWFTDVADPDQRYQIGYITPGMSGTVKLKRGRWYTVQGAGDLTLRIVNVRIS